MAFSTQAQDNPLTRPTPTLTLYINGRLQTPDERSTAVTAMAVYNGRILLTGDDATVRGIARTAGLGAGSASLIDLQGATVWPGLVDSHIHFLWMGLEMGRVQLDGTLSELDAARRVAAYAANTSPQTWIRGAGWSRALWGDSNNGRWPTRQTLDAVLPDHPVALTSKDGHLVWANSLALHLAGITATTDDPVGGEIVREGDGSPAGVLKENAVTLLERIIPGPTAEECRAAIRAAQTLAHSVGLTGIHDFEEADAFRAFQELDAADNLRLRVLTYLRAVSLDHALAIGLHSGTGGNWLRVGGIKIFLDGTLGSQTAAMLEPFQGIGSGAPAAGHDGCGILTHDPDEFRQMVTRAARGGLSCAIHAIGDRANRLALDTFAEVRAAGLQPPLPQRIEHAQLLHSQDVKRFAELGVVASMQPIHATSDRDMADHYWGERSSGAYAWASLLTSGATVAFGSDAPIESCNPFWGLYAALTRKRLNRDEQSWYPAERLSLAEALASYTTQAAYVAGTSRYQGQLAAGMDADFIVLPRELDVHDPEALGRTRPICTVVGGEVVYGGLDA